MKRTVILASASKQRSQILNSCGIRHRVVISSAVEVLAKRDSASKVVIENAKNKAEGVAPRYNNAVIIGADTLVGVDNHLIGKPRTKSEAKRLLKLFSGKKIEVFTGVAVMDTYSGKSAGGYEKSCIFVKRMSRRDRDGYFHALAPYDKSGAFSIEGAGSLIFDDIRGSYFNILGLPMVRLAELFKEIGLDILDFIKR